MIRLSYIQTLVAESVINTNVKIAEVAKDFGISTSTVRRYMAKYTEASLQPKVETGIENAYLIHIELHVGNDTRHLHQLIYAPNKEEAEKVMANLKPDYRGNEDPSYQLQIKGGPFKLSENLWMLEEY